MGVAFNADHVKLMEDRLMSHLKKEMKDSASPLFNAAYAEAVGARVPATSSENPNPKAKAKPKPKPVPKPKPDPGDPNPKPKKKAKAKPTDKGEGPPPLVLDDDDDGQPQTEDGVDDDIWESSGRFGHRLFRPKTLSASGCSGLRLLRPLRLCSVIVAAAANTRLRRLRASATSVGLQKNRVARGL